MGLKPDDVVLVYSSAPDQQLAFWFRIRDVEALPVEEMWARYSGCLGITRADYDVYFEGSESATGLHVGDIHRLTPIPLEQIQRHVPGFVPPQGLIWLREEMGRYASLLSNLSDPLPKEALPQLAFDFFPKDSRGR